MKKSVCLCLLSLAVLLLVGCPSATNDLPQEPVEDELIIQGSLGSDFLLSMQAISPARAVASTAPATSALLFYKNTFVQIPITDGKFEFNVTDRDAAGIVFVGADKNFLGYLTDQTGACSILPMNLVGKGKKTINLGSLNILAKKAGSSYDRNSDLGISAYESKVINTGSKFFQSVIQNPDFDGNNVIDVLEDKRIDTSLMYYINRFQFNNAEVDPTEVATPTLSHKIIVNLEHPSLSTATAVLTLPNAVTKSTSGFGSTTSRTYFFGNSDTDMLNIPQVGTYNFTLDSINYNFDVDNTDFDVANIIHIVPKIILNADNVTVHAISWKCYDSTDQLISHPERLLKRMDIEIDGLTDSLGDYVLEEPAKNPNRIYNSYGVVTSIINVMDETHVLPIQTIKLADVLRICMTYKDLFDNNYVNMYPRQVF